jgi:hypothetical protein
MHCEPGVVEELPVETILQMGAFLRLKSLENNWVYEKNQDLYIGVVQKLRRDRGQKCENPDDEVENVLFEAKQLALKDSINRKPGQQQQQRASDQAPIERPVSKSFKK